MPSGLGAAGESASSRIDSCADPNQIEEIDAIVRSRSNASVACRAVEFLLHRRSVNVDATLMREAMIAGLCAFANVGGGTRFGGF